MKIEDIDFSKFSGRKADLEKITRFDLYSSMFYRPNVYFHSRKVFHLVNACISTVKSVYGDFDGERALVMALVHDDAEIVTGDFQAGIKAKLTPEEVKVLKIEEKDAIYEISSRFPETVHGFNYRDLLMEVSEKNTVESQVVKYLDRFDAFCEVIHDISAGNKIFTENVVNEFGTIELPTDYYVSRFNDYSKNYPLLSDLVGNNQKPFLEEYDSPYLYGLLLYGKLHTRESFNEIKGYSLYDWWLGVMLDNLGSDELKELYVRKE